MVLRACRATRGRRGSRSSERAPHPAFAMKCAMLTSPSVIKVAPRFALVTRASSGARLSHVVVSVPGCGSAAVCSLATHAAPTLHLPPLTQDDSDQSQTIAPPHAGSKDASAATRRGAMSAALMLALASSSKGEPTHTRYTDTRCSVRLGLSIGSGFPARVESSRASPTHRPREY